VSALGCDLTNAHLEVDSGPRRADRAVAFGSSLQVPMGSNRHGPNGEAQEGGELQKSFNTLLTGPGPSSLRGPALPDHQHELVGAVGVADGGDFGGPCGE